MTPDPNAQRMREMIERLNKTYNDRKKTLESMTDGQIRTLAKDCGLPSDLNRTERIKYILQKEFPAR